RKLIAVNHDLLRVASSRFARRLATSSLGDTGIGSHVTEVWFTCEEWQERSTCERSEPGEDRRSEARMLTTINHNLLRVAPSRFARRLATSSLGDPNSSFMYGTDILVGRHSSPGKGEPC